MHELDGDRLTDQGIVPRWGKTKVIGRAVTSRMTAAGAVPSVAHLGVDAIASGSEGDVIPIERPAEVVATAEEIMAKVNAMIDALRAVESMQGVDRRFNYERMLR